MNDNDRLKTALLSYQRLMQYDYELVAGKKKKEYTLSFSFSEEEFYHLAGLQYIKHVSELRQNRKDVFNLLLSSETIREKVVTDHGWADISDRIDSMICMEDTLKHIQDVFLYQKKRTSSKIEADYILKRSDQSLNYYLFLIKDKDALIANSQFARFLSLPDVAIQHVQCTLLHNQRKNRTTHSIEILYSNPKYQPNINSSFQSTNIMSYQPPQLPRSDVLTATDTLSQSPKRFIDRLREFAAGIAAQVRKLFSSSKQPARPKAAPQHSSERQHNAKQAAPDHADQDSAPGASPQFVKQKPFTLSGARRSELAAEAKRAGHKERPQQRQAQTHSRDDDLLS